MSNLVRLALTPQEYKLLLSALEDAQSWLGHMSERYDRKPNISGNASFLEDKEEVDLLLVEVMSQAG
tara:strand:+ start:6278 stop:6478 length:201 start_codon:yes stop_codon:yes gene_type:complete